jgi:hypothetical protein
VICCTFSGATPIGAKKNSECTAQKDTKAQEFLALCQFIQTLLIIGAQVAAKYFSESKMVNL